MIGYKKKSTNIEDTDVGTSKDSGNINNKKQSGRTPKTRKYD